jgi:hypothetical protein
LAAFIDEAGLPADTGAGDNKVTIEKILQEKKTFDLTLNFEKLGVDDRERKWRSIGQYSVIPLVFSKITYNSSSNQTQHVGVHPT